MNFEFRSEKEMMLFSGELARICEPPLVIFLSGQLGAGKTTFSRGFLSGLGYKGRVKSPTYSILESYQFPNCVVFHFDFYRIHVPEELEFIGIRDCFTANTLCLIEWPEKAASKTFVPDIICYFEVTELGRKIELKARTLQGDRVLEKII